MSKQIQIDLRSLPVQMILSFVALVLLTAVAAGLPATWLLRDQLERQAWAQVEQGSRAAEALYAARLNEITDLATLTAQRPTLRELARKGVQADLQNYLQTLQEGAGLDLLLFCTPDHQFVAQIGGTSADIPCTADLSPGLHAVPARPASGLWLLSAQEVVTENLDRLGIIVAGAMLDDKFATRMRAETGLEHSLLADGLPVASSLAARRTEQSVPLNLQGTYILDSQPYYYARLAAPIPSYGDGSDLQVELALAVADIVATQRRLIWILAGSILAAAVVASTLGVLLARRISRPLKQLAVSATTLSKGDLSTPLDVEAQVHEVAMVAQVLEGARVNLQATLSDLVQEKMWNEHLLEAIVEGIVILDRHGHITFFSHGAERITGHRRDDVVGQACDHVFEPAETDQPFSQLIPPPGQRRKIPVRLPDGRDAILAVTGARLFPPQVGASIPDRPEDRVALVFRDVSEEEAVHRLLAHFLANIAHEFRTPLSALAASVELLVDQAPDLSPAELDELLTALHLGVIGLQTLVDNLLESASIEAGRFRISPRTARIEEIIAEAIRMIQPLLDKRRQRLMVELPTALPVVQADPRRTVQVLVNLLSNASKYGPDNSEIAIGAAIDGNWARVTVVDQGEGIPPEQRSDLFRRFVQLSSGNARAHYGAGLGLSVVKAIVEGHGGSVGIGDRPGGGASFWFTLPVKKAMDNGLNADESSSRR